MIKSWARCSDSDSITDAISRISEAALAPERWPAALQLITAAGGALGVGYLLLNKQTGGVEWVSMAGLSVDVNDYVNYYAVRDPYRPLLETPLRPGVGFSFPNVCPKLSFGAMSGTMMMPSRQVLAILLGPGSSVIPHTLLSSAFIGESIKNRLMQLVPLRFKSCSIRSAMRPGCTPSFASLVGNLPLRCAHSIKSP